MKLHPVGAESFHVDRQTDVMKLIVTFCNFVNVPRNKQMHCGYKITLLSNRTVKNV